MAGANPRLRTRISAWLRGCRDAVIEELTDSIDHHSREADQARQEAREARAGRAHAVAESTELRRQMAEADVHVDTDAMQAALRKARGNRQ